MFRRSKQRKELRALMLEARDNMNAIGYAETRIANAAIRDGAGQLIDTGHNILTYLQDNPDKISSTRRFFTYYLDTAREILDRYLLVQESGLNSTEVAEVTRTTERAMPILNQAFEKQYVHLMRNEFMEIETEVKLLELNLKMDR